MTHSSTPKSFTISSPPPGVAAAPVSAIRYIRPDRNIDYRYLSELLQPRVEILSDIKEKTAFLDMFDGFDLELFRFAAAPFSVVSEHSEEGGGFCCMAVINRP